MTRFLVSWVLGVVWTVTNILFIAYHVIYSLPAKTKRNMQRETMKMVSNQKHPLEIPDFKPLEGEVEEEFGKRRTTVRFGGEYDEDIHGWSSGSSLAEGALKSYQVREWDAFVRFWSVLVRTGPYFHRVQVRGPRIVGYGKISYELFFQGISGLSTIT